MVTQNQFTPEQVQQLLDAIKNPVNAYYAFKDGPRYSEEQQQQLVNCIAKDSQVASWALQNISWLAATQKAQLRVVA